MTCGRPSVSQSEAVMGNESQAEKQGPQQMRLADLSRSILSPVPGNLNAWVTVHARHLQNILTAHKEGGRAFLTCFQECSSITGFSRATVHTAFSSAPRSPHCHPLGPNGLGSQVHATQTFPGLPLAPSLGSWFLLLDLAPLSSSSWI